MSTDDLVQAAEVTVREWLEASELEWELGASNGEFVVTLPGEKKLKTVTSLVVGDRTLKAMAFVVRNPDENHEEVYRLLLQRNLRIPGVAYGIDGAGDVYLTGRLPLAGLDGEALDRLLGVMLEASDGIFNEVLSRGFLTSMKKEWRWRTTHGESTRNLEAFRHLLEND
ncbi:type III secretion system chaperone family protein [Dermacoccus barathri]|uniref:YbjN domain-containing protein n=1 Tax=Dermacoccus abyssi TaxID=322596 RepID=A0ABX5ZBI0_9MICO|nr:YbjN domain-containing protein [Dermacoccus barathri]MBE7371366.1 YbjN domain-containing protein [Dermacoccus barathri]QEH94007.1 YbjN domain-containing protein [Dermacoccus abyssi]